MSTKYNNIDDLFRDKFEDFEVDPPDYVWDNIKSGMGGSSGKGNGSFFKGGGIAGITLLVISFGLIVFLLMNHSAVISEESGKESLDQSVQYTGDLIAANFSENSAGEQIIHSKTHPVALEDKTTEEKAGNQDAIKKKSARVRASNPKRNSTIFIQPGLHSAPSPGREAVLALTATPLRADRIEWISEQHNAEDISTKNPSGSAIYAKGEKEEKTAPDTDDANMIRGQENPDAGTAAHAGIKSDYGAKGNWIFGLYFTPELISLPSDDLMKSYSYSVDLHASYKTGNYFLQSGIGFARNHEQGNDVIDYNKYMGSYEDVYNVTFDSISNGIVPVYHTETVFVYDTLNHVVITPTKRYFTYLQVPLFVGYGAESKRFGWFVKGGPSISFLIHEQIPESDMSADQARILNVENELPDRISTNWQFVLSAGVTYKLGNRISLSMEPMFRYYIKSAYEQDKLNTKHPYSVGLRSGIVLSF